MHVRLSHSLLLAASGVLLGTLSVFTFLRAPAHAGSLKQEPPAPSLRPLPVAPFPGQAPERVPIASYTLQARLDTNQHRLQASGTVQLHNPTRVALPEIWLHLYLNAFKNERSFFLRGPLSSGRGLGKVKSWGYIDVKRLASPELGGGDLWRAADRFSPGDSEDQTDIRVPLPRAIAPGETVHFDVEWEAQLPSIVERTGFADSFHMVAQWFPKLARLAEDGSWTHFPFQHLAEFYADYGSYDVTLDVPDGFVVGATGERQSEEHRSGRAVVRYVQHDVHDFAWSAWDQFQVRERTQDGVTIRGLYPPGYGDVAERSIDMAAFGLRYFGRQFGAYPYRVLTLIHPPANASEASGMEYPTLITTGGAWYEPRWVHGIEAVTLHELGHQYFYGLVGTNEAQWPFLDEGLNSYAEQRGMEARFGSGTLLDRVPLLSNATVAHDALYRSVAAHFAHDEPVGGPAGSFSNGNQYGALVYSRTATILRTCERVYGREALDEALRMYVDRYRFAHPDPDQLLQIIAERLGTGASQNVRTALFDRGWVDYVAGEASSRRAGRPAGLFDGPKGRETVSPEGQESGAWVGSALVYRHGTLTFPVQIELQSEDGHVRRVTWDGEGDFIRVPYEGESPLASVMVDPDVAITLDEQLFNNGARAARVPKAYRTLERAAYVAEALLQLSMP